MIGVALDCPSDSRVPTHGATSVPSMPAFSGNPILPTLTVKGSRGGSPHPYSRRADIGVPSIEVPLSGDRRTNACRKAKSVGRHGSVVPPPRGQSGSHGFVISASLSRVHRFVC